MRQKAEQSRRDFLLGATAIAALAHITGRAAADFIPHDWLQLAETNPQSEEAYWQMVKRQFFLEDGLVYLNSGTFGPTLRVVYDAVTRNLRDLGGNYNAYFRRNYVSDVIPAFTRQLAGFVGAKPDEIALTSGTTEAMNYIANGLDLKPGDEILTTKHEHLGGIYPWLLKAKRYGVTVKQIDLKTPPASQDEIVEQFKRAFTPRTKVLSFCHLQYTDGALMPVKELCALARSKGALSVIDGAQSVGMLDFKISDLGCDFYAASLHKWLTGPYGTGLLYVRDEMRDRLWPTLALSFSGWDTVDRDGQSVGVTDITYAKNWSKALLKYSSNLEYYGGLFFTVALALDFQQLIGRERIEKRIRSLAEKVKRGLQELPNTKLHSPVDNTLTAGLISFRAGALKTEELYAQMRDKKVVTRYIKHPGMNFDVNRFSTHIFNTPDEIDAALAMLRETVGSRQ